MTFSEALGPDYHGEPSGEPPRRPRRRGGSIAKAGGVMTGSDLADMVRLIERKLAWYGFTSIKVGPFIRIRGAKVFIDLLERDEVLCRLELDPAMQTTSYTDAHGLATLMTSLRGDAR